MRQEKIKISMASNHDRVRLFKKYGYDIPKSRNDILSKAGTLAGPILEVGTGKGFLSAALAKKGLRVTSIDVDSKSRQAAREYLKALRLLRRVRLKNMNAEKLLFLDRSFETVISVDFFHHAENPVRCLGEMLRVAHKKLVLADLNKRGMSVMARAHHAEGKSHPSGRLLIAQVKSRLKRTEWKIKTFRLTCHNLVVAERKEH